MSSLSALVSSYIFQDTKAQIEIVLSGFDAPGLAA
jgi:hypothetical protein